MEECFDTEKFIGKVKFSESQLNKIDNFYIFDRLCKKIDVVGKVYQFYTEDLSRRSCDQEIDKQFYVDLMSCFILLSERLSDIKLINTSLKLNDLLVKKKYIHRNAWKKNIASLERFLRFSVIDSSKV